MAASLAPLHDTAGAGLSLLDSTLHSRMTDTGVVAPTCTTIMYVGKLPPGMAPQEVCDFHATTLADIDREVTGLLIVQAGSFMGVVETSPEHVASLLREMQRTFGASLPLRVVGFTEDVPMKRFPGWSYCSVSLPGEAAVDIESESAASLCSTLYRTIIHVGKEIRDSGAPAHTQLQERFAQYLPSDERVQALAASEKLTSVSEWLAIFDSPVVLNATAIDSVYPLPPRATY